MNEPTKDLLEECITDLSPAEKDYKAFQATFCQRCRNGACVHAQWAADKFSARVQTQPDRMLKPLQLDPTKYPKYAMLQDFVSMFKEAVRLDTADRRGDWEVPVLDGTSQVSTSDTTSAVDAAIQQLAKAKGKSEVNLPDPKKAASDEFIEEVNRTMAAEAVPETEAPVDLTSVPTPPAQVAPSPKPVVPPEGHPKMVNTPVRGGIMIGGGPMPTAPKPPPAADPWAPKPKVRVVQPGAKIQMGKDPDDTTK